jgi:hypothetical protein
MYHAKVVLLRSHEDPRGSVDVQFRCVSHRAFR